MVILQCKDKKSFFFLIIFPSPLLHPSEAPCPTPAQSRAAFAESRAHGHFWEYFPNAHPEFRICRCTGADQSSHPIFQAQKPTCAFFSHFETKDANGGGGSEYVENTALPLTPATEKGRIVTRANCQRGLRTLVTGRVQSALENYAATFFFLFKVRCFWSWPVTLAKSQF